MKRGFTLAELLIALAILGVIATFTIPKVLQGQQSQKYNAIAKELTASVTDAVQALNYNGGIATSTPATTMTQYLNYTRVDTTTILDGSPGDAGGLYSCASHYCLRLHSGATVLFFMDPNCGNLSTADTYYEWLLFDPDGQRTLKGDSIWFAYNIEGRVKSWDDGNLSELTCNGANNTACPVAVCNPSWFSWDN